MNIIYNFQDCLLALTEQLPVVLIYYSHISVIAIGLFFALFVLIKNKQDTLSWLFFALNIVFTVWVVSDLIAWILLYNSSLTMFAWSLSEITEVLFFYVAFVFSFFFFYEKLPKYLILFIAPVIPVVFYTIKGATLTHYDLWICEAAENIFVTQNIIPWIDIFYILMIVITFILSIKISKKKHLQRDTIVFTGMLAFLVIFMVTLYYSAFTDNYNWSLLSLSGLPIFIALISFAATRYKIFKFKLLATEILVFMTIFLVGIQFTFIEDTVNIILNSITLVLLTVSGLFLVHSVAKVDKQREELAEANAQQITLIHFITHQVKGFFTKSRNIFSGLLDGDFGTLPGELRPMIQEGFVSDTKAVDTVQDILKASNIQKGTIEYKKSPLDFKKLVEGEILRHKANAETRGVSIQTNFTEGTYQVQADQEQLLHAVRNIIDNAIKYTPKGSVVISLSETPEKIRFSAKDNGIGITANDMKRLFTEGGRGVDSTKVNVESTGYGLYIVKSIIEAHGGKVWAESEGQGKGSEFIIEIPVK